MKQNYSSLSKFLSLVLRHKPEEIGITLDPNGWTPVADLLVRMATAGRAIDIETLREIVAKNEKKRFTLSDDGTQIRAAQGHSVQVKLAIEQLAPPTTLFHGTATRNIDSILAKGLVPGSRQQVHLSADEETATRVGMRHGKPVVLTVETGRMHADGFAFYQADNGVWLTDAVPPQYLEVIK